MKYCSNCGAGLSDNMRFCPECGKMQQELEAERTAYDEWVREAHNITKIKKRKKKIPVGLFLLLAVVFIGTVGIAYYHFASTKKTGATSDTPISANTHVLASQTFFSDDPSAIQTVSNSIVKLNCYDSYGELCATGSAFAAFDDGIFVTNCHVIMADAYTLWAQAENGAEFSIPEIIAYDVERDIAILRTPATTNISVLAVGDSSAMKKGAKVVAIGSPLGLLNSVSTGVYSGTVNEDGQEYIQFTASISQGSSGGALLNDKGEVIGITSASFTDGQNINLAIPIESAKRLYQNSATATTLTITQFYELWDHIKIYDVSYVLSHGSELVGQEIYVEGYISSIDYGARNGTEILNGNIYLVSSPSSVLGYVFQEGADWDYSNGNRQAQETMRSFSLECLPIYSINRNEVRAFSPGAYVKVHCQVACNELSNMIDALYKGISATEP